MEDNNPITGLKNVSNMELDDDVGRLELSEHTREMVSGKQEDESLFRLKKKISSHKAEGITEAGLGTANKHGKSSGLQQAVHAFSFLGGIGIYFCIVLGICMFVGNLADEHLGLNNKGKLLGIIIGFPIAIYSVIKQVKNAK